MLSDDSSSVLRDVAAAKSLFGGERYRDQSLIDKIVAKEDIDAIRAIIKRPKLTREDLLELLYLIAGTEAKLLSHDNWQRYVLLKYYVWLREFVKVAELLYDYQDNLKKRASSCGSCGLCIDLDTRDVSVKMCMCVKPVRVPPLSSDAVSMLENNERLIEHNAKFLIDLYLNIARTSLSVNAQGFRDVLTNRFEVMYPQGVGRSLEVPK